LKKTADYLKKRLGYLKKLGSSYPFWIGIFLCIGFLCEANLKYIPFLLKMERDFYDIRASFTTVRLDPKIIVVGIDAPFLNGVTLAGKNQRKGHKWPLPRRDWADFLRKAKKYKVGLVIFDIFFGSKKSGDNVFALQLKKGPPAILAQEIAGGPFKREKEVYRPVRSLYQNAAGVGYINATLAHAIRSIPLVSRLKHGDFTPSIDLAAARYLMGNPGLQVESSRLVLGSRSWMTNRDHRFFIRWANSYEYHSSHLVLQHGISSRNYLSLGDFFVHGFLRSKRELLKGSILLVGAFDRTLGDIVKTPVGTRYGVVVHANVLNDLLRGAYYVPEPEFWNLVILISLSLLVAFLLKRFSAFQGALITGILMLVYLILNCAVFYLGYWFHLAGPLFSMALVYIGGTSYQRLDAEKKKNEISRVYGKYLAPQVRAELMKEENLRSSDLQGGVREVTVLESDIRGFTSLSETLPAVEVVRLLNLYFTAMIPILYKHRGTWDKFVGDALLAYFGAPVYSSDHPIQAVSCAIEMLEIIEKMRNNGEIPFQVGIGIHTGPVKVGHIGADATKISEEQKQFTIIGDTVNLAARLCGLAEGGSVYISHDTYQAVKDFYHEKYLIKPLGSLTIKGKAEQVQTYCLTAASQCKSL
jgi:adenylate cyclase